MTNEKSLFIVSGPAGVGKDSVVQALCAAHEGIERSVTATTRAPRPGEQEGVNYYYFTVPEFEKLQAENGVLESNFYCGNYYGTPKSEVDKRIENGITVILVIEVIGAGNIKKLYPDAVTIFVRPPSYGEMEERLRGRGTETEESIKKRLARAVEEMEYAVDYNEVVINDTVDECAEEIYGLIQKYQQEEE